jgi:hypothetical protein
VRERLLRFGADLHRGAVLLEFLRFTVLRSRRALFARSGGQQILRHRLHDHVAVHRDE